jgi:hypothetical protein
MTILVKVIDSGGVESGSPTNKSMDFISLFEKQLR